MAVRKFICGEGSALNTAMENGHGIYSNVMIVTDAL